MSTIFNSSIIPGAPIEKHEHHRLMVIFLVAAVVIISILIAYYFSETPYSPAPQVATPVVVDQQAIPTNNNVLSADVKAQYINQMQAVVESQPAIPPDQKAALIQAMSAKLKINK